MLEKLRIQNFKSWQDTGDIAFGSLTGFFGTNSSGKSSILQFLLMLKQTVESSDRSRVLHLGDDKSYVDLGTMYDILFMHKDPSTLDFSFSWKPENPFFITDIDFDENELWSQEDIYFAAQVKRDGDLVKLSRFSYQDADDLVQIKNFDDKSLEDNDLRLSHELFIAYDNGRLKKSKVTVEPGKFYSIPKVSHLTIKDRKKYTEGLPGIMSYGASELENLFNRIHYLGPLREYPSRLYVWAGEQTQSVGNRGERAVAALLSSRNRGATIDMGADQPKRTVEEHVAYWLKELGLIYSFKVQPIAPNRKEYEVRIQRTAESASVFLTDVGFGVSQILPVLVLLFYVPEGSTVILEQPEIHLHPAVQAGLADVFIDAIKRRKLQIVLESHSEHLLQRLQRRLAEERIETDAIKLYFTSIKEGHSELTTLELDEYGNIHNWPAGFFGNAFEEAAAKMKAEMKRKMRQS